MSAAWHQGCLAIACGVLPAFACAATFRVDEVGTTPRESVASMQWASLAPSRSRDHRVEAAVAVNVRLNLAPWRNKVGRVYLTLPAQPFGPVLAEWSTQGRLLPGQLTAGQRTLVWAGPIRTDLLEDTLALRVQTDGRRLVALERLDFSFEIDVE